MRWDELFDDLAGQLERGLAAEKVDEQRDAARVELARFGRGDLLRFLARDKQRQVDIDVCGISVVGTINTVGADWLAMTVPVSTPVAGVKTRDATAPGEAARAVVQTDVREQESSYVIPVASVWGLALVGGLSPTHELRERHDLADLRSRDRHDAADPSKRTSRRIDQITFDIVLRDLARRRRWVTLRTSRNIVHGTLDVVGRDWCEVALHPHDVPRRQRDVRSSVVMAVSDIIHVLVT